MKEAMKVALVLTALYASGVLLWTYWERDSDTERTVVLQERYCEQINMNGRAKFILGCFQAAKPEGQWMSQCQAMAERILCPLIDVRVVEKCVSENFYGDCRSWRRLSFKPVEPIEQKTPDEKAPDLGVML